MAWKESLYKLTFFFGSVKSVRKLFIPGVNVNNRLNISYVRHNSYTMANKSALILIADGTEEMECIIAVDVLRRAKVSVTLAGVNGTQPVTCSRQVVVMPDLSLSDAIKKGPYDAVVLPGGLGGAKTFAENAAVGDLLKEQEKSGRIVGAICAAPTALKDHGISLFAYRSWSLSPTALKAHGISFGKKLTSYPSVKDDLIKDYNYSEDIVVVDGTLITSRGPGTAFDFALKLVEVLTGKDNMGSVKKGLLL